MDKKFKLLFAISAGLVIYGTVKTWPVLFDFLDAKNQAIGVMDYNVPTNKRQLIFGAGPTKMQPLGFMPYYLPETTYTTWHNVSEKESQPMYRPALNEKGERKMKRAMSLIALGGIGGFVSLRGNIFGRRRMK